MSDVVQTLWGFCHTLRHDGIDCGDYIEQIIKFVRKCRDLPREHFVCARERYEFTTNARNGQSPRVPTGIASCRRTTGNGRRRRTLHSQ